MPITPVGDFCFIFMIAYHLFHILYPFYKADKPLMFIFFSLIAIPPSTAPYFACLLPLHGEWSTWVSEGRMVLYQFGFLSHLPPLKYLEYGTVKRLSSDPSFVWVGILFLWPSCTSLPPDKARSGVDLNCLALVSLSVGLEKESVICDKW